MAKTVVLAVDESEASAKAVQWAAGTLLAPGDRAVLLHVEPGVESEPGLSLYPEAAVPPGLMAAIKRKRRERSQELLQRLESTCKEQQKIAAQVEIAEGDPRTSILDAVSRHQATLLVVGSRKMGALQRDSNGKGSAA